MTCVSFCHEHAERFDAERLERTVALLTDAQRAEFNEKLAEGYEPECSFASATAPWGDDRLAADREAP
jgi:hypothetical protein